MKKTKKQVKTFRSAKLVQYKGGGYDGCHWEWNFALVVDGVFHDVISSGRNAIKSMVELKAHLKHEYKNVSYGRQGVYEYNLNKKADLLEFTTESAESLQGPVIGRVNTVLGMDLMFFECTYCKTHVAFNSKANNEYPCFFHDEQNYSGNGGVGVNMHSILCEDCYCNTCEDCGSIFGPDEQTFDLNDKCLCEYCHKDATKEVA